jgi:dihydrolipoamide dehydrogenase
VLISIGRGPNTNNLGLENTNIRPDKAGFIPVERDCRTAEPRIYAIGDVAGQPMLAHKAIRQARVATQTIAGEPTAFNNSAIPAVVFTDPEVAWAGLTETEAKAKSVPYVVKKLPWGASGRAATLGRQDGTTKIICDPQTHRVLGIGIVGPRAGDLISEGVLAIEKAASAEDLAALIHPHPTLSETIGDAAELFTSGDKKHRGRA